MSLFRLNVSPIFRPDLSAHSVKTYGATGDGTTDDRADLNDMAAITGRVYHFPKGTYKVGSALTLPATSCWHFAPEAKLKPSSGVTVTLKETLQAGPYQIFDTTAGGSIAFTRNPDVILPQWWGAVGDGTTDDRAAIQAAIDAAADGAIIDLTAGSGWEISEALYIDKPLTIRFSACAPILQTTWGKPHFYIDQTDDVRFEGVARLRYEGSRVAISNPPATSPDSRLLDKYETMVAEATAAAAGDPVVLANLLRANGRTLAAGVYLRFTCDRFRADTIDVYGQVVGMIHATEGTEANYSYSADNHVGNLFVNTVDFGYLSGGFKRFTIGNAIGTNITCTQNDPAHVIYIGGQTTQNGLLTIGTIHLDGGVAIADASDALHSTDAFSIKDTSQFFIGNVLVRNAQYIGNTNNATGRIESISADLIELEGGPLAADAAVQFTVQNGSRVSLGSVDIVTDLSGAGVGEAGALHCSGSSTLTLDRGRIRLTHDTPGRAALITATAGIVRLSNLEIVYDPAAVPTTPVTKLAAGMTNPAAIYGNSATAEVQVTRPILRGETRLFYQNPTSSTWSVDLDPNLMMEGVTADTIVAASGTNRVRFLNDPITPAEVDAWSGTNSIQFRARKHVITANTLAATLGGGSGLTEGQRYLVVRGDNNTAIADGATLNLIGGGTIAAGAWDWIAFIAVTPQSGTIALYEVARG